MSRDYGENSCAIKTKLVALFKNWINFAAKKNRKKKKVDR